MLPSINAAFGKHGSALFMPLPASSAACANICIVVLFRDLMDAETNFPNLVSDLD